MAATTKQDMVQTALDEGKTAPADGVAFIKERFGVDMSRKHFSSTKNVLGSRAAANGTATNGKPKPKPAKRVERHQDENDHPDEGEQQEQVAPASVPAVAEGSPPSAADLARQLKRLVAEHGAAAVADMLAVFAE